MDLNAHTLKARRLQRITGDRKQSKSDSARSREQPVHNAQCQRQPVAVLILYQPSLHTIYVHTYTNSHGACLYKRHLYNIGVVHVLSKR